MLQPFGNFAVDNTLSQAFNDGGFTDTRLTNQYRVVFGTALQHLNGAADLFITANHRVKLALFRTLSEIDSVFFQSLTLIFSTLVIHAVSPSHLFNGFGYFVRCGTGSFQQIGQVTAIFKHRQHKQLG
ncbi:hypothetical protein D3C72_1910920 [compost metagenome]